MLDVSKSLSEIESNPELWTINTERQDYPGSAHKDTNSIILRGPTVINARTIFNDTLVIDYPSFDQLPETKHLIYTAISQNLPHFTKIGRIIIAKLKPRGCIIKHIDEGAYAEYYDRYHLVLKSKEGNLIRSWPTPTDLETLEHKEGDFFKFPHRFPHEVINFSDEDRIHIIIDARKDD